MASTTRELGSFDKAHQAALKAGEQVKGGNGLTYTFLDGKVVAVGGSDYNAIIRAHNGQPANPYYTAPGKPSWDGTADDVLRQLAPTDPQAAAELNRRQQGGLQKDQEPQNTEVLDELGLTGGQRNAYEAARALLKQYDLEELADTILGFAKRDFDSQTIGLLLQDTDAYKTRFAGNALRKTAGLSVLAPAEYLSIERAYRQAAQAYGLPKDFYDHYSDFARLIGNDISPDEFTKRAAYAHKYVSAQDPAARNALLEYYGVDTPHLVAHFLDPDAAASVLERQSRAADLGATAKRNGIGLGRQDAERYGEYGIDADQAQSNVNQLYGAGFDYDTERSIASRFGADYTEQDRNDEAIGGMASARRKREQMNKSETALFSDSGGGAGAFGVDYSGGY